MAVTPTWKCHVLTQPRYDPQLLIKPVRNRMPAKKTSEETAWINTLHSWNRLNYKSWPTKKNMGIPRRSNHQPIVDFLISRPPKPPCEVCQKRFDRLLQMPSSMCWFETNLQEAVHFTSFLPPIAVGFLQNSLNYLWQSNVAIENPLFIDYRYYHLVI